MKTRPFDKNCEKNRIYYYCKLKTAINYILPPLKLRISPMLNTNDPRENKSFVLGGIADNKNEIGDIWKSNTAISKILRDDCKVLCFCGDTSDRKFGYELSRMWALYGDNHKGVCLELDKEVFIEENNIDPKYFKNIQYVESSIPDSGNYKRIDYNLMKQLGKKNYLLNNFRNSNLDYLYFTKDKEWESENEIRLILFSNNSDDEYCSIRKSLKNIFLGVDFQKVGLPKIMQVCQSTDISKLKYRASRMVPETIFKITTSK